MHEHEHEHDIVSAMMWTRQSDLLVHARAQQQKLSATQITLE